MDRTSRCNKVDEVRLYASNRLNLLLLKAQRCVKGACKRKGDWERERGRGRVRIGKEGGKRGV